MRVDAEPRDRFNCDRLRFRRNGHHVDAAQRRGQFAAQFFRFARVGLGKGPRVAAKGGVSPVDFEAFAERRGRLHEDAQTDAVGDLGAELALFGIHRADQGEARGIVDRMLAAFNVHHTLRRGVEQRIEQRSAGGHREIHPPAPEMNCFCPFST